MSLAPTFDGSAVFGAACHVVHEPRPIEFQMDAFPGINGLAALALGGRGRTFHVTGILLGFGEDDVALANLIAAQSALLSFADGLTHIFTDTQGNSWPNVIFNGHLRLSPEGPRPLADGSGWGLPFQCTLEGLS